LNEKLPHRGWDKVRLFTIYTAEGLELPLCFFDTTVGDSDVGFINKSELINVGISRGKDGNIIVGSPDDLVDKHNSGGTILLQKMFKLAGCMERRWVTTIKGNSKFRFHECVGGRVKVIEEYRAPDSDGRIKVQYDRIRPAQRNRDVDDYDDDDQSVHSFEYDNY
jgi:hypothetical protein